jgi:hypothetical protein
MSTETQYSEMPRLFTREQAQRFGDYIQEMYLRGQNGADDAVEIVRTTHGGYFPLNIPELVARALDGTLVLASEVAAAARRTAAPAAARATLAAYVAALRDMVNNTMGNVSLEYFDYAIQEDEWVPSGGEGEVDESELMNDLADVLVEYDDEGSCFEPGEFTMSLTVVVPATPGVPSQPLDIVTDAEGTRLSDTEVLVTVPPGVSVEIVRQQYSARRQSYRLELALSNAQTLHVGNCADAEDDWDDVEEEDEDEDEDDWN